MHTKEIEIFRTGKHTASNGSQFEFTAQDLQEIAESYDPQNFRASLVCGHPKDDHPAWGVVKGLRVVGDRLKATVEKIAPQFVEWVRDGRYHSISPSFYLRESPSNPTPGKLHLKHIGALGAVPPAVKGLEPLSMSESVEEMAFSSILDGAEFMGSEDEGEDPLDAAQTLFRKLREFLISEYDIETADRVLPNELIDEIDEDEEYAPLSLVKELGDLLWGMQNQVSRSDYNEPTMTEEELQAKLAEIEAREAAFAEKEQAIAAREAEIAAYSEQLRDRDINSQVDALIAEGRVLPAEKQRLVAFMQALPTDTEIEFGEEGEKQDAIAAFVSLLKSRPSLVPTGEIMPETSTFSETVPKSKVAIPHGVEFDPESDKLDRQVRKHMAENGLSYSEAVAALGIQFGV